MTLFFKSSGAAASPASSSVPKPSTNHTAPPNYYSTSGAFNGTGLALATQSFGQETYGTVVVYFQHWEGDIRSMSLTASGSWIGGDESTTVATNARNGTPIAAVAYAMNGVSTVCYSRIPRWNIADEYI